MPDTAIESPSVLPNTTSDVSSSHSPTEFSIQTFVPKFTSPTPYVPPTQSHSYSNAPKKSWRMRHGANQYAFADDRFTFPPVPGYTGYIPRSREHFGKSYNVTTSASLGDFETLYAAKDQLPEKVQKITQGKPVRVYPHLTQQDHVSAVMAKSKRAAELQAQCSTTSFISGYTGFVPQMRNQFGEQYQKSAVLAMQAWKTKQVMNEHYLSDFNQKIPVIYSPSSSSSSSSSFPASNALKNEKKKLPIPGYTGFIPLSKYAYAHTYGHSLQALKTNRPVTDDPHNPPLRKKDLAVTLPIPGYKGFLPFYQMCGEKSFGQTSKKCIQEFKTLMNSRVHEI